jgi:hypothetical protein
MALPTVVTSAGLTPRTPADVLASLIANVLATNPGYTANLPGSLIEDIASTDVAAVLLADTARVDLVNSLTPYGANAFILNQLGQQFGITLGAASNTSVFVQFVGTPGFVISVGFTITDGTYQYVIQDGGIIGTDRGDGLGVSPLLFAVSPTTGSWAVGSGTLTSLTTSVPGGITLSVSNPQAGIPSQAAQTEESYRAQVLNGGLANSAGTPTMLKTLLANVTGVQSRLISIIQLPLNAGWEIIVGGGDPYLVGKAIFDAGVDISALVGSSITISGITKANPGVVTTSLNHGLTNGQTGVNITGSNPSSYNVASATVTVIDQKTFSYGVNTTGFANYVSGGVVTPNPRNVVASINDYPDTYSVPFVSPPQQTVTVTLIWNTTLPNFVSSAAVAQAGAPAIAAYINAITVGQPINVFQMQEAFEIAVSNIINPTFITRMVFTVSINGVGTSPTSGTGIIAGDPESYFFTSSSAITITQG